MSLTKVKHTLSTYSPEICIGLGIVSFIASAVMAAKATPKAQKAKAENEEIKETMDEALEKGETASDELDENGNSVMIPYSEEDYNEDMKLKNIRLTNVIIVSMFILTYPLLKSLTSEGNKALIFLDAMTITSLGMVIFGVIYNLYLKGDLDASKFIIQRNLLKKKVSYETYSANEEEKRKDSFNYPLFMGIVYLCIAYLVSKFF